MTFFTVKYNSMRTLGSIFLLITLVFSSCKSDDNNLTYTGENKKLKVVFKGYTGQGSSNLKNQNENGETTILDTYIKPLNDQMQLVATLEAPSSSLTRSGALSPFDNGVKIRAIAVQAGTNNVVSYGDFTTGGTAEDTSENFQVPVDAYYDFYFISYNSTTDIPEVTTPPFKVELGNHDFLYAKLSNQMISESSAALDVTLKQSLTKVSVLLDASADGIQLESIGPNSGFYDSYKYVNINSSGALEKSSDEKSTRRASWSLNTPNIGATTSSAITVYVDDSLKNGSTPGYSNNNFYVFIDKISFADTTWTGISAYFNKTLQQGVNYTINLTLARTAFAGSNIYWDGSRLTFDSKGETGHEQYQGVFFKWGSLTGISPTGDTFSTETPIYQYNNMSHNWSLQTASSWEDIPYVATGTSNNKTTNYLYTNTTDGNGTGDICRYLASIGSAPAGNWRMPTSKEFLYTDAGANNSWSNTNLYGWSLSGSWGTLYKATNSAGTYPIPNGTSKFNAFFPAAGARGNEGSLSPDVYGDDETGGYYAGGGGNYWTGSSGGSGRAYSHGFNNSYFGSENGSREEAYPVRCVKIK